MARGEAHFFGHTYHLMTPAAWAEQVLGLNVMVALVGLLQKGIRRLVTRLPPSAKRAYTLRQDLQLAGRGAGLDAAIGERPLRLPWWRRRGDP